MKDLYISKIYENEIKTLQNSDIFSYFSNKNILITGGTGLILSYLINVLLSCNSFNGKLNLVVRNVDAASKRFLKFIHDARLKFISCSLEDLTSINDKFDLVISGASKTDPYNYAIFPVEVMTDNINGCRSALEVSKRDGAVFLLLSSCEVYGQNDKEILKEGDVSIISPIETRSAYNLAKMASENLALSYKKEYGINAKIIRFSRIFGPTIKINDTKALSQFLFKVLNDEDVILKSKGEQKFSYQYVGDSVRAIAYLLNSNETIVNSTNEEIFALKDLASYIASLGNKKVIFDIHDDFNGAGYSKAKNSILDISRLKNLGFKNIFNIKDSLKTTYNILKEIM